ncbi:MAG: hypothetical protein Greene071436_236 [Parcubacteria group bacterium Greene0714_36]|nr:MAG: hypothetical protein Greene071436_236 [Parcubacteria group bacterium Greene0714_36]
MPKYTARAIVLIGGAAITMIAVLPLISSRSLQFATDIVRDDPYVAPLAIVLLRFVGVVVAPIPGSPIMFASIAIMPWWQAWVYNFIGSMAGSVCAFFIARTFREPVVARFAPLREIHQWQGRVSQQNQFWAFAGLRLVSLVAFDFVNYAAGLTRIRFRTYLLATLIVEIPIGFLFFYFGGVALRYSIYIFLIAAGLLVAAGVVVKLRYKSAGAKP